MTDVRSLLRNELASRKATSQPNTTGNRVSKKRKVENGDGIMRKKLRSNGRDAVQVASDAQAAQSPQTEDTMQNEASEPMEENEDVGPELPVEEHDMSNASAKQLSPSPVPAVPLQEAVNEDEWAAFEREVVEPTKLPPAQSVITAHATISAAPITAAELVAQQERDKATTQTREAELEGEREDAARLMEDELDEMDQLEERVRKLKHRRDELRQNTMDAARDNPTVSEEQQAAVDSESEDDEEEDWDDWRFK
ncbi:hypothetical protein N7495_004130 [Penicillium taxi]|uniref:uncharacterized protein n=1 Tax=Penicillium taxi TaxID=168475 RepID=UPI002545B95B|nr:uncharacterized protein N7495_004130 [Penicillium taxi]KAJ5899386.1 hypothetical protein N7495_004130 [Penicillium taxi]